MSKRYKRNSFLGIYAEPGRKLSIFLRVLPFVLLLSVYLVAAEVRYAENPDEKIVPTIGKMVDAMSEKMLTRDTTTGTFLFWEDTYASLTRLLIGVFLATWIGFFLGLNMGMLPSVRESSLSFVIFMSFIPPLSVLPILLIVLGVGEVAKIALIFFGTVFFISRDVYLAVTGIPVEMKVKAQTLGASQLGIAYRVVAPQVMPRLIESVRLTLGSAWLFLIAAEYIGSVEGLGYRIFISMRYLGMNVIIPYVLWITLLAFLLDRSLNYVLNKKYRWYAMSKGK